VDKVDSIVEGAVKQLLHPISSLDNRDLRSLLSCQNSALDFLRSPLESSDWDRRTEIASSCVVSSAVVDIENNTRKEFESRARRKKQISKYEG